MEEFQQGDLVWFDPGFGYVIPGEVVEFHRAGQVISIQALIGGKSQVFTMNNIASVKRRQDLGALGLEDMIQLGDLNEASLLWNLRMRYDKQHIYTYTGSILVAVNPYKMFDIYGLDMVKKYEGQILGILPPHLFAIGSSAYSRMSKDNENQVVVISGESGAGKTESTKLIMQYLAAVNKSTSNLITEQILEASPLLEAFGNAKTVRNDNSSRFGKYLEVHFKGGVITGANTTEYLLEKSRIVTQAPEERNYHVFYEILAGLNDEQKEKYGLLTADKYFYLNQGGSCEISCKDDGDDFEALLSAMQVLGFTSDEQETIFKILAAVLHLGNIYFHRKPLKHGQEGVEIGSDAEVKWASHLLQLSVEGIAQALTTKTTEARNERLFTPLNIDQALDARDAIAKALYSSLFSWLVQRINSIVCKGAKKTSIAILDIFGFEDFKENSFEQLCINYANETLQFYFNKHIFKLEQQEYAKEKIDWQIISFQDNQPVINLISKKPVGLLHLLDDESNFPKATDVSFLEKCHYNHALNELYSRPRMSSMEFGVTHYAGQVWYSVEGFLDKNRDTLRSDVIELLISSKVPLISKMFMDLRNMSEAAKTISRSNGRFVTMKPRTPTVAARFHDSLLALVENMGRCNPWFVRCIKPNNEKAAMNFDMAIVLEQLRYTGMLETIKIRKMGYPMRLKFQVFADRYRCLVPGRVPKGVPAREICRVILDRVAKNREQFQLGTSKVFLRESMEQLLEQKRYAILNQAAIAIQKHLRGRVARKRFLTMRRSAVKIQSQVRGHLARKNYEKVRRGIVRAQATYRMSRQKRRFAELKDEIRRREVAEKEDRERAKVKAQKVEQEKMSRATAAGVNHLEIPAELAFIFSKLDDWQPQHGERNIIKVVGNVPTVEERYRLPSDIDYYAFSKFINVYFKSHTWGMRRDPIKTPFLAKLKDSDYHESLAVFKLILRFMNDNNLTGRKETVLGDYIVQKGLVNESMRDEILCQLCNQTWKNDSESATERGWLLMANCLSCFPPSKTLYKYLLKYVSDNAYNGYKATCQKKLLQSERIDPFLVRTYPPCMLEWKSNRKHCNMALEVAFPDGQVMYGPVESWTVGEQFAAALVKERRISECWGWTVSLHTFNDTSELNGYDYVLDLISSVEVPPAFPICKISFLSSHEKDKEQKVEKRKTVSPVAANAEVMKALEVDVIFAPPIEPVRKPGHMYRSRSHEMILEDSRSHTRGGDREGFENALSRSSMLNERYFDASIDERNRSGSLERLGLSRSRLNERYRSMENLTEQQMVNQNFFVQADVTSRDLPRSSESTLEGNNQGGEKDRWGLSPSSLNGRYFHQAEMEKQQASATRTRTEESVRHSQNDFHSSQNDFHDNKLHVNGHSNDLESSPSPDLHGSNGIVDFSEFDFQDLNGDRDTDQDTSKYSRVSSSRFVKSNNKKMQSSSHSHSTKGYLETKFPDKDYAPRSSAMSDTSEAPSLASHVRQVRVPSHTSDLDQYLDDLFNPVLDGNLDELSDARSLAASIKGGGDQPQEHCRIKRNSPVLPITEDTFYSSEHQSSGVDDFINDLFSPIFLHHSVDTLGNAEHLSRSLKGGGAGIGGMEAQGSTATQNAPMLNMMLGGLQSPLTGMMSPPPVLGTGMPTTSVPTMMTGLSMMPPMNSTLPLYSLGGLSDSASGSTPLMYAYVPLYNASGFSLPMWNPTSGMVDPSQLAMQHQLLQQQQQAMQINATQVQHMQQRAFLASAVQQNLQMQQQLMQQNQALQQLLQQNALGQSPPQASSVNATPSAGNSFHTSADVSRSTSAAGATSQTSMTNLLRQRLIDSEDSRTQKVGFREPEHSLWSEDKRKWTTSPPPPLPPKSGSDNSTPSPPNKSVHRNSPPQKQNWAHAKQASFGEVISELRNRRSSVESNGVVSSPGKAGAPKFVPSGNIPPPPPLPPELPETSHPFVNVYGRAKTVRIGKWRWPPPRSDGNDPDNYFEFKLKQHHKRGDDDRVGRQDRLSSSSDEKPEFFPEKEKRDFKLDSPPHDSFDNSPARNGRPSNKSFESNEPRPSPGSVGKLKISSEMRAKLEAVTANHSVRSTSNKSDARRVYAAVNKLKAQARDDPSHSVRKLEENRKLALQRQLGGMYGSSDFGDDRVSDVNESIVDRMEKDSRSSVFNRLSAPPPPPVAPPSFTIPPPPPSTIGDASSYYDPGGPVIPEPKSPPAPVSPSSRIYSHHQHHNRQNRLERIQHIERSSNFTERTSNYTERNSNFAERNSNFAERNSNFAERNSNFAERTPNYSERALNYAERTPNYAERTPNYAERTPNYAERTSNYTERTHHDEGYSRSAELANITDEADSRQLENMKTKLYPQNKLPYNTYTRTPWNLHIRKEVFTPSEQLTNPLALHIIFCQVVQDAFSPSCIRMTKEECKKLRQMLDGYGITPNNMQSPHHKTTIKKNVVDIARDYPTYFSRLFPVSGGRTLPEVQMLGVSHSGVRLIRREKDSASDWLRVLEEYSFEDVAEVSIPRGSTLQLLLRTGHRVVLFTHRALQIRNLIDQFALEADSGAHEYVRAVADYVTRESTLLSFRQGDIIRVVNKNQYLDKGWLYGILDGRTGIFPCEYVVPLGRNEVASFTKEENIHKSSKSVQHAIHTETHHESHTVHRDAVDSAVWADNRTQPAHDYPDDKSDISYLTQVNDGKHSLLQFALLNFRQSLDKYEMLRTADGSIRGSLKLIESLKSKKKGKKGKDSDWTWKEQVEMVKYTKSPIQASLLRLESTELNKLALECFIAIMRYMGDYPMAKNQTDVDCVYTILMNCHRHPQLRDEVYCQIMKQTTNNKSPKADSCQKGWRLFSIIAAYFDCSDLLKPYLFKYLETAAYDKRRAYHGTAMVCLQNLRKTFKFGGRKNVPSIEEITAITAGRNSKRQIYRLPGGTERVINTKSTSVVADIIEEICTHLNIRSLQEMEEFSLYCIVEGDTFTMPLAREEYILDVTTELHKNQQVFYLIFCRSVWYYPLRLDSQLYIEVVFNQIAPDYLEGLLLIMPGETIPSDVTYDIAKVAALLHRAAQMENLPSIKETKYLLPKPALNVRDIKPPQWVNMVQNSWRDVEMISPTDAKVHILEILQKWPLFGSSFYAVKKLGDARERTDFILAINRNGVDFLDIVTHETLYHYPFSEVISTRKVKAEDGALFLDMKVGNLMVQKITRIQTEQAHEISRLIKQYIMTEQRNRGVVQGETPTREVTIRR